MSFAELSPELYEKTKACHSPEELAALAMSEGIELTDEQLAAVAGGAEGWAGAGTCPHCGSTFTIEVAFRGEHRYYGCLDCGKDF